MSFNNFYSSSSSSISNRAGSSLTNNGTLNQKSTGQNVCLTLPITCQICLGKVKEPCVCPNLHAFCSFCIEIWLEKTKQCPTCRIPIDKDNPCRRILGGIENLDDVDLLKPTEFSHSSTRKARFMNLFQQYEDEVSRLNKYIDSLNDEVSKLKETIKNGGNNQQQNSASSPQHDMIQMLKTKLQNVQTNYDEAIKERDELKEKNKKLESENSMLIQDIVRLKANLNEKNSQATSKYAVAALESKIEGYEKEIKQLQKALDKSDKYIAELESKKPSELKDKENKTNHIFSKEEIFTSNSLNNIPLSSSTMQATPPNLYNQSPSNTEFKYTKMNNITVSPCSSQTLKFIKGDNQSFKNDLRVVKFAEKVDKIPSFTTNNLVSPPPSSSSSSSSYSSTNQNSAKKIVIPKDNFYGSPSKSSALFISPHHPQPQFNSHSSNLQNVLSFNERLKKNLFNTTTSNMPVGSFDFETPNQLSQSMITMNNNNHNNHGNNTANQNNSTNILLSNSSNNLTTNNTNNFLFSPMKRLRLDEVIFEKPCFCPNDDRLNSNNENMCKNSTNNNNLVNNRQVLKGENKNNNCQNDENSTADDNLNNSTSEFIDCIELLNQAEKKVQNRQASPMGKQSKANFIQNTNSDLDEKYMTSLGTTEIRDSSSLEFRTSSTSSSGNSLAATITTGASSLNGSSSDSSSLFNFNINNKPNQTQNIKKYPSFEQNLNTVQQLDGKILNNTSTIINKTPPNNNTNSYLANLNNLNSQLNSIKTSINELNENGIKDFNNSMIYSNNINSAINRSRSMEPKRNIKS